MQQEDSAHSMHSTLREHIVEHVFVGDVLRSLWRHGVTDIEVLRSEFDRHGYDLVMSRGPVLRHIQFKTGQSARPAKVSLSLALAEKPSGCAIWIKVSSDLRLGPFFFFGGNPGEPLPSIADLPKPLRATHNKDGVRPERTNHRVVPGSRFERFETIDHLIAKLFGALPGVAAAEGQHEGSDTSVA